MPSYEPKPRRFSIVTVSHTTTRRNSIDDATRPSLIPPDPAPEVPPIDLASALRKLQHVETEGEERGRSRHSVRRSGWGDHDGPVTAAPAARRETSASTRERIALWEERSRSQSKGRSKSRVRDLGAGSRISVVPEMPELAAALSKLEGREQDAVHEDPLYDDGDVATGQEHTTTSTLQQTEKRQTQRGTTEAWVLDHQDVFDSTHWEDERQAELDNHSDPPSPDCLTPQIPADDAQQPGSAFVQESNDSFTQQTPASESEKKAANPQEQSRLDLDTRPHTPVRAVPVSPLTPDATPTAKGRCSTGESTTWTDADTVATALTPATPILAPSAILPLTPDATPEQPRKNVKAEAAPSPTAGYTPIDRKEPRWDRELDQQISEGRFHLPPDLLADSTDEPQAQPKPDVKRDPEILIPASAERVKGGQQRYHQVWRISSYEPEIPLAERPARRIDPLAPEEQQFTGQPLRQLLPTQAPAEPITRRPAPRQETQPAPNPYPYSKSQGGETKGGNWVINMPPSPTAAYAPSDARPRQPRQRSTSRQRQGRVGTQRARNVARQAARQGGGRHEWDAPPVIQRAFHAASVSMIQGLTVPVELYRGLRNLYYPPPGRPDIVKAYSIRRRLPVRIFFPTHHDLTSPALLPTLFTLHGGAFTVGSASDDDLWNRTFSDAFTVLVIALNYSKAPWAAFPQPLLDAEALYHAALNDESLPIDRMRTAITGFDAGGNLALGLAQLPSVRTGVDPNADRHHPHRSHYHYQASVTLPPPRSNPPPAAVISICGILDFTTTASAKARTRPYKKTLRGPRGWGPGLDWMGRLLPSCAWSYIPYGHDAADPLLSPAWASRADLPPHVFVVAAELDCLAHESWRAACAWAGRAEPTPEVPVGRPGPAMWRGCLDDGSARFGWSEPLVARGEGGATEGKVVGSTRWLLVPDVVHGFDSAAWRNKYLWGDEEARMDAEMKTAAYQRELAEWLWGVVWK